MSLGQSDTHSARSNGAPAEASREIDLPDVPDVNNTGTRLVRRVVGLTFSVIGILAGIALLVGFFVRIDTTIDAQGTLEPVVQQEVRARESGSVVDVFIASGDTVQRGQVLAQFDTLQLKSQLVQLRSQYRTLSSERSRLQAETTLDEKEGVYSRRQAQSEFLRSKANLREQLATYGYNPKASIDSFMASYDQGTHIAIDRALAEVISAKTQLRLAKIERKRTRLARFGQRRRSAELQYLRERIRILERRLDQRTVTSPISGLVLTNRPKKLEGQFIQQGNLLFEIAKVDEWQAVLIVNGQKVSEITVGDQAKVEVRAFRDETKELVDGHVRSVALEPMRSQQRSRVPSTAPDRTDRYRVSVELNPNDLRELSEGRLRQGYTVEGKVITDSGRILRLLWDYLRSSA